MRGLALLFFLIVTVAAASTQPGSGASTQAATQPAKVARVFTSMMDVLNKTPIELRPKATGEWQTFTKGKFIGWVNEQMVGMAFDQEVQVSAGTVMQNVYKHEAGEEWMVYPAGPAHSFSCFGTTHRWGVGLPLIFTDEAGAKKWYAEKSSRRMRLTGVIKSVGINVGHIAPGSKLQLEFGIVLGRAELTPVK